MYTAWILLGGVFEFLHQYVKIGSLFFGIAVLSYYVVQGIWSFVSLLHRYTSYHCEVRLCFPEGECTVDALIDTGNSLSSGDGTSGMCVRKRESKSIYKQ